MTLIELLAVMVVALILMTISIPAFISMGRGYGLRHTVSIVFTHLSLARQWAITHREDVTFQYFTSATNSSFAVGTTNKAGVFMPISTPITNTPGVFFDASGSLVFMRSGGLRSGFEQAEIMIGDGSISKTIVVNALTGGITVRR